MPSPGPALGGTRLLGRLEVLLEVLGAEPKRLAAEPQRLDERRDAADERPSRDAAAPVVHRALADMEAAVAPPHDDRERRGRAHHDALEHGLPADVGTRGGGGAWSSTRG